MAQSEIINALESADGGLTVAELAEETGLAERTIREQVAALLNQKAISRRGGKVYLAEDPGGSGGDTRSPLVAGKVKPLVVELPVSVVALFDMIRDTLLDDEGKKYPAGAAGLGRWVADALQVFGQDVLLPAVLAHQTGKPLSPFIQEEARSFMRLAAGPELTAAERAELNERLAENAKNLEELQALFREGRNPQMIGFLPFLTPKQEAATIDAVNKIRKLGPKPW